MACSIELSLKLLKKSDKNEPSVRLSTPRNETIFYINRRQHSYNWSEPITRLVVNDANANGSSYQGLYSFQMIPLVEPNFEYGENCSQSEIIKYFRLSKQGEIFLASHMLNSTSSFQSSGSASGIRARFKTSQLLSLNMICFVNIRVLDLRNPFKLTASKELVRFLCSFEHSDYLF